MIFIATVRGELVEGCSYGSTSSPQMA